MIIPIKVIKAMKLVINKRNLSPELIKMCRVKDNNTFVGTDSFVLFEFTPKEKRDFEDFSITHKQLMVIEKLSMEDGIHVIKAHKINDQKVIEFLGLEGSFYLPQIEHKFPDYKQTDLFGSEEGSINGLFINSTLKKFIKAVSIIRDDQQANITDKTYSFDCEDDFGQYKIIGRLPILNK